MANVKAGKAFIQIHNPSIRLDTTGSIPYYSEPDKHDKNKRRFI